MDTNETQNERPTEPFTQVLGSATDTELLEFVHSVLTRMMCRDYGPLDNKEMNEIEYAEDALNEYRNRAAMKSPNDKMSGRAQDKETK